MAFFPTAYTDLYPYDNSLYSIAVQPLTSIDSGVPKSMWGFPNSQGLVDCDGALFGVRLLFKTSKAGCSFTCKEISLQAKMIDF